MDDALRERVDALERAVTDGDCEITDLADSAETVRRLESAERDLESIEDRVAELEAATQALRGYVGNIRSVNRDVEQRADAALATAQAVEAALDDADPPAGRSSSTPQQSTGTRCHACGQPRGTQARAGEDGNHGERADSHHTTHGAESADIPERGGRDGSEPSGEPADGDDRTVVPEPPEETGTLQRVREML